MKPKKDTTIGNYFVKYFSCLSDLQDAENVVINSNWLQVRRGVGLADALHSLIVKSRARQASILRLCDPSCAAVLPRGMFPKSASKIIWNFSKIADVVSLCVVKYILCISAFSVDLNGLEWTSLLINNFIQLLRSFLTRPYQKSKDGMILLRPCFITVFLIDRYGKENQFDGYLYFAH